MKKKKVLKIVGIILAILLVILLIYCIRNIVIFNSLSKVQNVSNYAYAHTQGEGKIEVYHKDGINKEIWKLSDGTSDITWYNSYTKEAMYIDESERTVRIYTSDRNPVTSIGEVIVQTAISNNTSGRIYKAITTFITTEEVDGVECYVLHPWSGITSNTYYFNKGTKTLEQAIIGLDAPKTKFYNWKINEVTNADISLPDLSDYEVTDER